jgi:hypothetical protein
LPFHPSNIFEKSSVFHSRGREGRHTDSSEQPERPKSVPLPQAYFLLRLAIASHHVIILVADSSDASCPPVHAALIAAGAFTTVIGLKQQAMFAAWGDKSGKGLVTDHQFEGARSKLLTRFIFLLASTSRLSARAAASSAGA